MAWPERSRPKISKIDISFYGFSYWRHVSSTNTLGQSIKKLKPTMKFRMDRGQTNRHTDRQADWQDKNNMPPIFDLWWHKNSSNYKQSSSSTIITEVSKRNNVIFATRACVPHFFISKELTRSSDFRKRDIYILGEKFTIEVLQKEPRLPSNT